MTDARTDEVVARAARVRLVAFDVDGTLTDARLHIGRDGEAMKSFSVRDGFGLTLLREAGIRIALVTARRSTIVEARAAELRIEDVLQSVPDKAQALRALCGQRGVPLSDCAFVGDDWPDLRAMSIAGLAATVRDAPPEVRERAHWVSTLPAGRGAVREFAEFVLRAKGVFDDALARHAGAPGGADSGNADSGNADSGNADPGNADPGNADPGNAHSRSADSGSAPGGAHSSGADSARPG